MASWLIAFVTTIYVGIGFWLGGKAARKAASGGESEGVAVLIGLALVIVWPWFAVYLLVRAVWLER